MPIQRPAPLPPYPPTLSPAELQAPRAAQMSRAEITPSMPEARPLECTENVLIHEGETARHRARQACVANTSAALCLAGNLASAGALAYGIWQCLPLVSSRALADPVMRFGVSCLTGGAIGTTQMVVARAIAMNSCPQNSDSA